jgi:chromosome segregation ATPase
VKDQTTLVADLKGTIDRMNGELTKLKDDNTALAGTASENKELQEKIAGLQKIAEDQKGLLDRLEEEKRMLIDTRKKLAQEVNELTERLQTLLEENETKQETIQRLKEDQSALVQNRQDLVTRLAALQDQIDNAAAADTDGLRKDAKIEELTAERQALELERDVLTTAYNDLAVKVETLTSQFQTLHREFGDSAKGAQPVGLAPEFSTVLP